MEQAPPDHRRSRRCRLWGTCISPTAWFLDVARMGPDAPPRSNARLANSTGHSGAAELHAPRMPSARAQSISAGILREDLVPRAAARPRRRRLAVRRRRHRHGDRHKAVQPRPPGPPWPPPPRAMTHDSRSLPLAANAMCDSAFPAVTLMMPVRDKAMSDIREALCSIAAQDYPGTIETVIADGSRRPLDHRLAAGVCGVRNPARATSAGLNGATRSASHGIIACCDADPDQSLRRFSHRSTPALDVVGRRDDRKRMSQDLAAGSPRRSRSFTGKRRDTYCYCSPIHRSFGCPSSPCATRRSGEACDPLAQPDPLPPCLC